MRMILSNQLLRDALGERRIADGTKPGLGAQPSPEDEDRKTLQAESRFVWSLLLRRGWVSIEHDDEEAFMDQFVRTAHKAAQRFTCERCRREKTSKNTYVWTSAEGTKTICNGCHGALRAERRKQ